MGDRRKRGVIMKKRMSVYDFCDAFLSNKSLLRIEYLCGDEPIFEGTAEELVNTIDADLRTTCSTVAVRNVVPSMLLQKGIPLSITLLI